MFGRTAPSVELTTGGSGKIDGAYSYGGAGAAVATVQRDFGVHVDDYIWIGLLGLVKLIDAIGGIDVVTSNPVLDDYYPQDINSNSPYGYQRIAVLGGPQHMDGVLVAVRCGKLKDGEVHSSSSL